MSANPAELTTALASVERMIYAYAYSWHRRNPEVDLNDLAQEGRLGFCRAFERYRPDAGCKLSSFATPWIHQAMRKCVHATRNTIRVKSLRIEDRVETIALETPWGVDGDNSKDTLADCLPAPEPEDHLAHDADLCAIVAAAVEALPRKKRAIIKARFFEGRTFGSIGQDYGVSREAARKLYLVALDDLKNHPVLKDAA